MAEDDRSSSRSSNDGSSKRKSSHSKKKHRSSKEHRSKKERKSSKKSSGSDDEDTRESTSKSKRRTGKSKRRSQSSASTRDDVKAGRSKKVDAYDGEVSMYAIPSAFSTPNTAGDEGMFTVSGGGKKKWDHYSSEAKEQEGYDDESIDGSARFSVASMTSVFSTPAAQASASMKPAAAAVKPGAVYESANDERIQDLLDRKFNEFEGAGSEESDDEDDPFAAPAVRPGAQHSTEVPDRIQDVLDRKFQEFNNSNGEDMNDEVSQMPEVVSDTHVVTQRMHSVEPMYVTQGSAHDGTTSRTVEEFVDEESPSRRDTNTIEIVDSSIEGYGTQIRHSIAAPPPDILTNHLMEGGGVALSGIERKEMRLAAGLCAECGRTQTHEKIKYGPFQAFRRMEPLTTPGHVYKGYCLFCNNIHDLRTYLHEPYLREQDLNGSENSRRPLMEEAPIMIPQTDESDPDAKCKRIQCLLCTFILIAIGVGIALAVSLGSGGGNEDQPSTTSAGGTTQAPPPTPAPGSLQWAQLGPDITEDIPSFGFKVDMSASGTRIAVASPKDEANTGRVDIYELVELEDSDLWTPLGLPIFGDAPNDEAGFAVALSDDGNTVIIGHPGNGNGFARVYTFTNDEWTEVGSTLVGPSLESRFGASVGINSDGNVIIVGSPYDTNKSGSEAGSARTYQLQNGEWTPLGQVLLGAFALDHFGNSVGIDDFGKVVAVGAPNNDERWENGGQVHVFQLGEGANATWTEPLSMKILGEDEGQAYGTSMSMNGIGNTIVSSAVTADGDDGTAEAGDPRVMYLDFDDQSAEELGFGFPAIPETRGLGYSLDVDEDGTKTVVSTLNGDGVAGKVMAYDIFGLGDWVTYGQELGGDALGADKWLSEGPSVAMSALGTEVVIGYESLLDSESQESRPVVRVYRMQ